MILIMILIWVKWLSNEKLMKKVNSKEFSEIHWIWELENVANNDIHDIFLYKDKIDELLDILKKKDKTQKR